MIFDCDVLGKRSNFWSNCECDFPLIVFVKCAWFSEILNQSFGVSRLSSSKNQISLIRLKKLIHSSCLDKVQYILPLYYLDIFLLAGSSARRPLFQHPISLESTTKFEVNYLDLFPFSFHI